MEENVKDEWKYKIIDKREENEINKEEKKQKKTEEANTNDKRDDKKEEPIEIDILNTLKWMFEILRSQIYIKIGLIAHPQTNLVVQDFPQAKLGIDVIMTIFEKITPFLKSDEHRVMQSIISDLQINYVNQLKKIEKV